MLPLESTCYPTILPSDLFSDPTSSNFKHVCGIKTNILTKLQEYLAENVSSRVQTRFS